MGDPAELSDAERMLLSSFRLVAQGRGHCPVIKAWFEHECGGSAALAAPAFKAAVLLLGRAARRRLKVRPVGCPQIEADEEAILAMFAAAQRSIRSGQEDELHARLAWLLGRRADESLVLAVQTVAAALAANQRILPDRRIPDHERARPAWRQLRVVH